MNSIVKDIVNLLQDKSSLLSPYISVYVISSSCLFKMLSSIFLVLVKRDCLADWKRGQWKRKWVVVSIYRPQTRIWLIQSGGFHVAFYIMPTFSETSHRNKKNPQNVRKSGNISKQNMMRIMYTKLQNYSLC